MKALFLLLVLLSCGKNSHSPVTEEELSLMKERIEVEKPSIPQEIRFKAFDHKIHFTSLNKPDHDFFEVTDNIARFYSFEVTHIHPDTIYRLETHIPSDLELYLHDNNKDLLIHPENFKLDYQILERLLSKKSYLVLKSKMHEETILIRNFKKNEILQWQGSIEDYLRLHEIEANLLSIEELLNHAGDNYPRWWIKKDNEKKYQIIYASTNELKESFLKHYHYSKTSVKRVNGQGNTKLITASFIKISGSKIMQHQKINRFEKTFYTQIGELPYQCSFEEAHAQVSPVTSLSHDELTTFFGNKLKKQWNYINSRTLQIALANLSSGFFNIGLISRKCPTSAGRKIQFTQVNSEKELELVIESYARNE